MIVTVNSFSNATQNILGPRVFFRRTGGVGWVDLGVVKDLEPDEENEEYVFEGARNGQVETYGIVPIRFALTYTLSSKNPTDPAIKALHAGSPGAASGGGTIFVIASQPVEGDMIVALESAEKDKASIAVYHPKVTLRRDGISIPQGEEAGLEFSATVIKDEEFDAPAGGAAPYGFEWIIPTEDLEDTLETLAGLGGE